MICMSVRSNDVLHVERIDMQRVQLLQEPRAIPRVARVHEDRPDVAPSDQRDGALDGLADTHRAFELRARHPVGDLMVRVRRRVRVLRVEVLRVVADAQHVNGVQRAINVVQRDVGRSNSGRAAPTSAPLELLWYCRRFHVIWFFVDRLEFHKNLLPYLNHIKNYIKCDKLRAYIVYCILSTVYEYNLYTATNYFYINYYCRIFSFDAIFNIR